MERKSFKIKYLLISFENRFRPLDNLQAYNTKVIFISQEPYTVYPK